MTTPKAKCKECGYVGDGSIEVIDNLCQDCADKIRRLKEKNDS